MLAVLLSFGAVNSLIPLLIIIMLIAAAAGLTRGYNLFAIFGIGTLVGAASAAKKGSVVGRNPYKSVAAKSSSLFMPKPKSGKALKAEREEREKNKETAKGIAKDIDQQLKSEGREEREKNEEIEKETEEREEEENEGREKRISTILKTGNYFGHPKQKGKYVKLAETAAKVPVPPVETPATRYRNKLKRNEEIRKAVRAQTKNLVMAEREQYLESITTAMSAEIGQLVASGKWNTMSEKQKIALVEKGFVRPVKGQRSNVAMASALLRGDIKGLKEEFNKAPSNSKALIGIVGALATGAGVEGANRAIVNELKKMPNYGEQTQPGPSGGPTGFQYQGPTGFQYQGPTGFQYQGKRESRFVRIIKSYGPITSRLASFVFLSPIGWVGVTRTEKGINKLKQMKQKGKEQPKATP